MDTREYIAQGETYVRRQPTVGMDVCPEIHSPSEDRIREVAHDALVVSTELHQRNSIPTVRFQQVDQSLLLQQLDLFEERLVQETNEIISGGNYCEFLFLSSSNSLRLNKRLGVEAHQEKGGFALWTNKAKYEPGTAAVILKTVPELSAERFYYTFLYLLRNERNIDTLEQLFVLLVISVASEGADEKTVEMIIKRRLGDSLAIQIEEILGPGKPKLIIERITERRDGGAYLFTGGELETH